MKILLNYIFDDFGITICPKLSSFLTVILLMPCAVRFQLPSELRLVSVSLIFFSQQHGYALIHEELRIFCWLEKMNRSCNDQLITGLLVLSFSIFAR